jgi:hypothetical protein
VVALRLLLLVIATAAAVVAIVIAVAGRQTTDTRARYTCPMHPEVRAAAPGQCPICRMALEPVARDPASTPRAAYGGMMDTTAVENVRKHKILDFVRVHSLLPKLREMRGAAWIEESGGSLSAIFYKDQIAVLDADEPGTFSLGQAPGTSVAVRRLPDQAVAWDRSTARIRFALDPEERSRWQALRPGQVGWVDLAHKTREVLGVPSSALLQSPEGPYVLVSLGGGHFEKRRIEVGEIFVKQSFAVVLSGLERNDLVASRATFFLDADRRLGVAAGEAGMAGP